MQLKLKLTLKTSVYPSSKGWPSTVAGPLGIRQGNPPARYSHCDYRVREQAKTKSESFQM